MPRASLQTHVPYAAIERHGLIGDRRTAALVSADGTIDWLCLPDYDGDVLCGAILDHDKGGFWRLGPELLALGKQCYLDDTATLVTAWKLEPGRLELTDVMAWPGQERPDGCEHESLLIRRLRCTEGPVRCLLQFAGRRNFKPLEGPLRLPHGGFLRFGDKHLWLWSSRPCEVNAAGIRAEFTLNEGEELWAVLHLANKASDWSMDRARALRADTEKYWRRWSRRLGGPWGDKVRRSAMTVHLLTYAPTGAVVAAPTTSLPERIGGDWNADYRLSWVRDSSLSLDVLATFGLLEDARRYLEWLCGLPSVTSSPLQVLYSIHGEALPSQTQDESLHGYRGSRPIKFGNHAYRQNQHDSAGFLIDCVHTYLQHGGEWRPEFWELIRRVADYMAVVWDEPGNSIWELSKKQHYVYDRVMNWVALERAACIAGRLGHTSDAERWRPVAERLHRQVMECGWSDDMGAFRQRYEGDNLDAANLLIPLVGFLPLAHERVRGTVDRVVESLTIDNYVYRFDPVLTPGVPKPSLPLGEYEGAFLPCTFWLAAVFARQGKIARAEKIIHAAEAISDDTHLFAEGVDPRSGTFLGNFPLLFSHVTYLRALRELQRAAAK